MYNNRKENNQIPFFALHPGHLNSAKIIREAKEDLKWMSVKKLTRNCHETSYLESSNSIDNYHVTKKQSGIKLKPLDFENSISYVKLENVYSKSAVIPKISSISISSVSINESNDDINSEIGNGDEIDIKTTKESEIPIINMEDRDYVNQKPQIENEFHKGIAETISILKPLVKQRVDDHENTCLEVITILNHLFNKHNMFEKPFDKQSNLVTLLLKLLHTNHPVLNIQISRLILKMKIRGKKLEYLLKNLSDFCENKKTMKYIDDEIIILFVEVIKHLNIPKDNNVLKCSLVFIYVLTANNHYTNILATSLCHKFIVNYLTQLSFAKDNEKNEKYNEIIADIFYLLKRLNQNKLMSELIRTELFQCISKAITLNINCVNVVEQSMDFLKDFINKCKDNFNFIDMGEDMSPTFIELLRLHKSSFRVIQHITFIISKLIAMDQKIAAMFYCDSEFLNLLFSLSEFHTNPKIAQMKCLETTTEDKSYFEISNSSDESTEILANIVGILANMCLNSTIGYSLANNSRCIDFLLQILNLFEDGFNTYLEAALLFSSLITLNNISYFITQTSETFIMYRNIISGLILFVEGLFPLEIRVESCNIITNFTIMPECKLYIIEQSLFPIFINLLHASDKDIVIGGCAIVINVILEDKGKQMFHKCDGINLILHKLDTFMPDDQIIAKYFCQILLSYCKQSDTSQYVISSEEKDNIIRTIKSFIHKFKDIDGDDGENNLTSIIKTLLTILTNNEK